MEELIDLIVTDSSPNAVTDKIKDIIFAKSAEKIDSYRPVAAAAMFGEQPSDDEFEEQDEIDLGNDDAYEEDREEDE
jgi:hypothetical protein